MPGGRLGATQGDEDDDNVWQDYSLAAGRSSDPPIQPINTGKLEVLSLWRYDNSCEKRTSLSRCRYQILNLLADSR